jgi:divalent metal cation (Fe/Co/Zn/Cd) transporter
MIAPQSAESSAACHWTRVALNLVIATMAYNVLEAVIALWSGTSAASIALIGFGLDSVERTEQRVHRFVGITFLLLATYVTAQAGWTLSSRAAPEESPIGIGLAVASLIVMPLVAWGKLRAAREIGSGALRAEAKETLACSYLSFTLLLGLAANAAAGWWWADPLAALLMVPWLILEGLEGLRGEDHD